MATEKNKEQIKEDLAAEAQGLIPLQQQIEQLEAHPEVIKYLQTAKEFKNREKTLKATIQEQMEKYGIKSIKGTWGYMTIVERSNYKASNLDEVPSQFIKKALDTSKVAAHLKLKGKLPKGVETDPSQSLTISLKPREVEE